MGRGLYADLARSLEVAIYGAFCSKVARIVRLPLLEPTLTASFVRITSKDCNRSRLALSSIPIMALSGALTFVVHKVAYMRILEAYVVIHRHTF